MKKYRHIGQAVFLGGILFFGQPSLCAIDFFKSSKLHFMGQAAYSNYNLGNTQISELGIRPM
ncbi:MAG: hypothetical protein AABY86_04100, partial [Bdellovibrionota bacterium]